MLPLLSTFSLKPINVSSLPLPKDGWRIAMLLQYPENPSWTITTCLTKSITFKGKTCRTSSWNPAQVATRTEYPEHRAIWISSDDGWTADDCQSLINDGYGYCYLHDSLEAPQGFESPVLSISEYQDQVLNAVPSATVDAPAPSEQIHAG